MDVLFSYVLSVLWLILAIAFLCIFVFFVANKISYGRRPHQTLRVPVSSGWAWNQMAAAPGM